MDDDYKLYRKGASNEEEAKLLTERIAKSGISRDELQKMYNHWAPNYNKDLMLARFRGTSIIIAEIVRFLGEKKDPTFLDCACGTGFIGSELKSAGFTKIDGLDSSESMLEEARKTEAYRTLILTEIGSKPMEVPDDTYDVVVMSGALFFGHVPPDCLLEFSRITKPNGLIVISKSGSADSSDQIPELVELESLGKQLEHEGNCRLLEKVTKDNFHKGNPGFIYIFSPMEL